MMAQLGPAVANGTSGDYWDQWWLLGSPAGSLVPTLRLLPLMKSVLMPDWP